MKKTLFALFAGLALGAALMWLALHGHDAKEAHAEPEKKEEPKHDGALHWTKEQQAAAGVTTSQPKAIEVQPELKAFGRVLDASTLSLMLGDIDVAQVAADASLKEFTRVQALRANGENASARALETAEAALKRDRALLALAQSRLAAAWGTTLAERTDLPVLAESLLKQKAVLFRVDLLPGESFVGIPKSVRLAALTGDETTVEAEVLGVAPSADPQNRSPAFIALLRTNGPPPGALLTAFVPVGGAAEKGVLLPRSAILRHDGEAFVWLQTGDDKFERRRVELGRALNDGILALSGVVEGDRVVVTAAQQLLSEELKASGGAE